MLNNAVVGENENGNVEEGKLLRRSDLPVYSKMPEVTEVSEEKIGNEFVFQAIKSFRMEGCKVVRTAQSVSDRCSRFFNTGVSHAYSNYLSTIEFLHEERNILPRVGAIGGGVLCGYILGLRKGFIKRFLYTTIGGIVAGAVCYPKEAEVYYQRSTQVSKKYFVLSYHFINGVTKDLVGIELPVLPLRTQSHDTEQEPVRTKKD